MTTLRITLATKMPIKKDNTVAKIHASGFSPRVFAFRAILVQENNKKNKIGINIIEWVGL